MLRNISWLVASLLLAWLLYFLQVTSADLETIVRRDNHENT